MSFEAVAAVIGAPVGGNQKVVLIGIANHAHNDGTNAFPSVATLSTYAHCDRRTVQRHLRDLEAAGWIQRTGWHAANGRADRKLPIWRVPMDRTPFQAGRQNDAPLRGDTAVANGATSETERGDTAVANGATLLSPEQSLEQSKETSKEKKGASAPLLSDDDARRAERFQAWFVETLTARRGEPPRVSKGWTDAAGRVVSGRSNDEIKALILWALDKNEYTARRVLTLPKLAHDYADLRVGWLADRAARERSEQFRNGDARRHNAADKSSSMPLDMHAHDKRVFEHWERTGMVPVGWKVEDLMRLKETRPWEDD